MPFQPFPELTARESFVSGGPSTHRLRVAYFRREGDKRLVGRAWFGPDTQGPPGHAHGGAVSAVMDEALGAAAWAEGHHIVVARLCVDFRAMVPLGTDAAFEAWVETVEGRKVTTRGRLTAPDGSVLAEGEALCVGLPATTSRSSRPLARPRPPATPSRPEGMSRLAQAAAWAVHAYTASGALLAWLALVATLAGDYRLAFCWLAAQVFVDSTDGWLARLAARPPTHAAVRRRPTGHHHRLPHLRARARRDGVACAARRRGVAPGRARHDGPVERLRLLPHRCQDARPLLHRLSVLLERCRAVPDAVADATRDRRRVAARVGGPRLRAAALRLSLENGRAHAADRGARASPGAR